VKVATPLFTVACPICRLPELNVTEPVASPLPALRFTVAVRVALWLAGSGFGDTVSVVAVDALATVTCTLPLDGALLESPLYFAVMV
jgi:hypothetical protein